MLPSQWRGLHRDCPIPFPLPAQSARRRGAVCPGFCRQGRCRCWLRVSPAHPASRRRGIGTRRAPFRPTPTGEQHAPPPPRNGGRRHARPVVALRRTIRAIQEAAYRLPQIATRRLCAPLVRLRRSEPPAPTGAAPKAPARAARATPGRPCARRGHPRRRPQSSPA